MSAATVSNDCLQQSISVCKVPKLGRVQVTRDITISEALEEITTGRFAAEVAEVRRLVAIHGKDSDEAKAAKLKMPAYLFSGQVDGAVKQAMPEGRMDHSGILTLDFDGIEEAEIFRDKLASDPHVIAAWISPSGNGVKGLCAIERATTEEQHKAAFLAAEAYFAGQGLEMDPSGKNSNRLCFAGSDPDARIRSGLARVLRQAPPQAAKPTQPPLVLSARSRPFPEPPEHGIHTWLAQAARWCEQAGMSEAEAVAKLRELEPRLRRCYSHREPEDAARLVYNSPSKSRRVFNSWKGKPAIEPKDEAKEAAPQEPKAHKKKADPKEAEAENYFVTITPDYWAEMERRVYGAAKDYKESVFARELNDLLPHIFTTGDTWRVFDGQRWEKIAGSARFLPLALRILAHFGYDTHNRARDMIAYIGAASQTTQEWRGAYAFDKGGAVLLNLANGILRVTKNTVRLSPHDWKEGFTLTIPTAWEEQAGCPAFMETLSASMPDADDRELFRLFAGSILEPSARLEAGLAVFGPSGTGKSTLVDSGIAEAVGGAKAGTVSRVSLRQLCDPKSYSLPNLEFSLVNIITEGDALEVEESGNFKSIVSGEPIECREIYGHPRVIVTTAKLLLATNSLPRFRNGTDAEGRRLRLLNFDQAPAKPDPELKDRIHAEAPGILRWMVGALQDVLSLRSMPRGGASAKRVTDRFALSNDSLGCFVKQECELDPTQYAIKSDLLDAFNEFADSHGFAADNNVWFFRKLLDRFPHLSQCRRHGLRVIAGIYLKSTSEAG
jgi:P4 family phage/plasmid primase-like protien